MTKEYVLGFLHNDTHVVLVQKNRPEWQAGKMNGVGGKIEPYDQTPVDAMQREFKEETGQEVLHWEPFLTLNGTKSTIYCYAAYDYYDRIPHVKTVEDEEIMVVELNNLEGWVTVPNLKWIVPLMTQRDGYVPIEVNFYGEETSG